jgi:DNA-binding HxlR family transcriptional regulator
MAVLDLLGRRWALRILWELRAGAATFRELRARCDGVSPTVLNTRLRELRAAGIVALDPGAGFATTADGAALLAALAPVQTWADAWGKRTARASRRRSARAP